MATNAAQLIERFEARVGEELGVTDWFAVSQEEADAFSALSDDWDYMHNDPAWAEAGPWGGMIAHGIYLLSRIFSFYKAVSDLPLVNDDGEGGFTLNYGFDRVRFVEPLRIGAPARARIALVSVERRPPKDALFKIRITVETEGGARPAMVADNLLYLSVGSAARAAG